MLLQGINSLQFETMLLILKEYESRIDISKIWLSAKGLKWFVKLGTMSSELFPFKLYWIFITPCQSVQLQLRGDLTVWIMNWIITYPRNISLSSLSGGLIILLELDLLDRAVNDLTTNRSKRFILLLKISLIHS